MPPCIADSFFFLFFFEATTYETPDRNTGVLEGRRCRLSLLDMEPLRLNFEESPPASVDDNTEVSDQIPRHPREDLESWRWPFVVVSLMLAMLIIGMPT